MTRVLIAAVALLIPLLGGACSRDYITVRVSAGCNQAIAEAAPPSEYSFLVSAESAPDDIEELNERDLLVCGMLEQRELLQLMTAPTTQGTLLFRSVKHWYINPSLDSGETHTSEDMTVLFPTEGEATLPFEKYMRGRDAIGEPLLASCMENMDESDVLLLDKDLGVSEPEELVSLVFR